MSKSFNNKMLLKNINKMHCICILFMKFKNLSDDIIDIIMYYVTNYEKMDFTNYSKIINKQNNCDIIIDSIHSYLYLICINNGNKKKEIVMRFFDYLINNSYFINKKCNLRLAKSIKLKIKEIIKKYKNSSDPLDIELINKLNESNQKIFGLKKINLCNKCSNYVSSLKCNYNLCFNHLCQKFSF